MSDRKDLEFGLTALQLKLLSREQLLVAVSEWFNEMNIAGLVPGHAARDLERVLLDLRLLKPSEANSVHESLRSRASGQEPVLDPATREALFQLSPPAEVRVWLRGMSRPAPAPSFKPRPRDERYEFREEIARGGLGRVLDALDRDLGRDVAVKLTLDGLRADDVERFVREARLTAQLDHPNIVPVYDFGVRPRAGGGEEYYLCMKRIRGMDLELLITGLRLGDAALAEKFTRGRLLAVFQDVCLGIAYAHSKGVIHRDLKPPNVMVGEFGETLIVDWGLAKEMGKPEPHFGAAGPRVERTTAPAPDATQLTLAGDVLGTPTFMAPEQFEGRLEDIDARSDVYALGSILYSIVALRPAFLADEVGAIGDVLRSGRLRPPSAVSRAAEPVPPELDAVCLRAMAYRREDRFQSALELHDEIQRFLEGSRELERRRRAARERSAEGLRQLARYRELDGEIQARQNDVERLQKALGNYGPADRKRPIWDAQESVKVLREDRIDAYTKAGAEFGQALVADPACAEALAGMCELQLEKYLEAEAVRDDDEMQLRWNILAHHDRQGTFAARLDAPGRLLLRTWTRPCDCLRPVKEPGWRVEFGEAWTVPWRDGRARPGEALRDEDLPVPKVLVSPRGTYWGHGAKFRASRCRSQSTRRKTVGLSRAPRGCSARRRSRTSSCPRAPGSARSSRPRPSFPPASRSGSTGPAGRRTTSRSIGKAKCLQDSQSFPGANFPTAESNPAAVRE
ncbi:MAG: serine/threonine protein kinase [Planctomycetota bacterium]|nr:MAG: serine/threonine protein kinase [Planctomycetota bacterium]